MTFADAQSFMATRGIDAWLVYDFRGSNPVLELALPGRRHTTRRAFLLVPARGEPTVLVHGLDANQYQDLAGVRRQLYTSWREMHDWLRAAVSPFARVAMEYAPGCTLPVVSVVDAGTVELVRSVGVEVVSSADVIQFHVARWSPEAVEAHERASALTAGIKDEAFDMIRRAHRAERAINERQVQEFILGRFEKEGLETAEAPIVAVNGHAGDPHFEVSAMNPSPIVPGDWVLIDLWSRFPGNRNIFSDITWVGYCGATVPTRHREVFGVVRAARDASVALAKTVWSGKQRLQGWQLDDAARDVIVHAGYERGVKHRTGHSLSPGPPTEKT